MIDVHASPDCCWITETDLHGKELRVRPKYECRAADLTGVDADRAEINRRFAVANAVNAEILHLRADVLAENRNERIDALFAWLMRERDALNDHAELLMILREEEHHED